MRVLDSNNDIYIYIHAVANDIAPHNGGSQCSPPIHTTSKYLHRTAMANMQLTACIYD